MSTVLSSPTQDSTAQKSSPQKKRKLAPARLKRVPDTRKLRERFKAEAAALVSTLDRRRPFSQDELEQHGRALLERMDKDEGYLGFAMVMIGNAFWKEQFQAVPFDRRILLLPHCLKHAEGCPADYDELGLHCEQCGACSIVDFKVRAEKLGYRVLVAEGTPIVLKLIVGGYVDGILGVACLNVLEQSIDKVLLTGVPAYAVPLHSSDCKNTSLDESWVMDILEAHQESTAVQTRSYVPLLRVSNDMFEDDFERLLPRVRGSASAGQTGPYCDPVAGTETIAYDWLAHGGKRYRPFITLAAFDALHGAPGTRADQAGNLKHLTDSVRHVAMAIETFHKASLVHDDIEDDDEYRYGQQTLHRRYGLSNAINVGDYLIGLGYRLVSRETKSLGSDTVADILDRLGEAHIKLSEGQGAELLWREAKDKALKPIDALKIYALKTAPAFEAALYAGIRLAGPTGPYEALIASFSKYVGVAFQILNDLKDWAIDHQNKILMGQDVMAMRPTVMLALALKAAGAEQRTELLKLIGEPSNSVLAVERVRRIYGHCGVFDKARQLVDKYRERAEALADEVEPAELGELLYYLVDTVLAEETSEIQPETNPLLPIVNVS